MILLNRWSLAVLFTLASIQTSLAVVNYADSTFLTTDWTETVLLDTSPGSTFTYSVLQDLGNPSPGRTIMHDTTSGPASVELGHLYTAGSYDPLVTGAINSVDYSLDGLVYTSTSSGTVGYALLVIQNGTAYTAALEVPTPQSGWHTFNHPGLTESDFVDSASQNPDFSAGGAPMQWGFATSSERASAAAIDTGSFADNWMVTINHSPPVPEPASSALVAIAFAVTCGVRRR